MSADTDVIQLDTQKHHFLTVVVEDYFHASAINALIPPAQWQRFERRVAQNTRKALDLIDEYDIKATFFVLGWVADEMPDVVKEIVGRGHEVACKGYLRQTISQVTPDEFRRDAQRCRDAIERASGQRVLGYRVAQGTLDLGDLWALDILADEGFAYDSSIYPMFRSIVHEPWRRFPHVHRAGTRTIVELPLSTFGPDGCLLRAAGGNYIRQLPATVMQYMFRFWHEHYQSPFNMYFHVWELDSELPKITAIRALPRIRQYRNLKKMPDLLRQYFETYRFVGIADGLRLNCEPSSSQLFAMQRDIVEGGDQTTQRIRVRSPPCLPALQRCSITIVVPCFNEEDVLHYLANTLEELMAELEGCYDVSFVFVDDGSSDRTAKVLQELFGDRPDCQIVRHQANRGVASSILTGIRQAKTEIVCSIDADCTYDPHQLPALIVMLEDDVDLVTASPYHVLGSVRNVPTWRLFLSKSVSRCYRLMLNNQLATYTSCFRVYRKSAIEAIPLRNGGFHGVTEMLCWLDLNGSRVVECPAILEVRLLGRSKLKTFRAILGHLILLARLAGARIILRWSARKSTTTETKENEYERPQGATTPHASVRSGSKRTHIG